MNTNDNLPELPEWSSVLEDDPSAIRRFLYHNEPGRGDEAEEFRELLTKAIHELILADRLSRPLGQPVLFVRPSDLADLSRETMLAVREQPFADWLPLYSTTKKETP